MTDLHPRSRRRTLLVAALAVCFVATAAVNLPPSPDANIGGGGLILLTYLLVGLAGVAILVRAAEAALHRRSAVRAVVTAVLAVVGIAVVVLLYAGGDGPISHRLLLLGGATAVVVAAVLLAPRAETHRR